MAKGPGHRPLILARWILLGLLLIGGAAVLRIYLAGDSEPATPRSVANDPKSPVDSGDVVLAAEGFEYEVIDEGVTLFFIRSERMVSDRQNRFVLEGVELRMEEEAGRLYVISSDRAVYDLESRDAALEGSVVMQGPDGIELSGEAFNLQRGGRILESTAAPVAYRLPGAYTGTARGVRINLHLDSLLLRGGVIIDSPPGEDPPVRLTAGRMLYQGKERLLRTEGGVLFTRGPDRLASQRLSVTFAEGESGRGRVRFIQGRWKVQGLLRLGEGDGGVLQFDSDKMGVAFDSTGDQIDSVVLEGADEPATLRFDDGAGTLQTLRSQSIFTTLVKSSVSRLETAGPAILEESLARAGAPPLRRLCGNSLVARFEPQGGLRELVLDGSVDFHDARLAASGARLEGDPENVLRLTGRPARVLADRRDVEAREIVYSRRDGSILATGGVRASGLDRAGVELASGEEEAPVLVTADRAAWSDQPAEILFTGNVRAWQGESFLLAERLRILENGARLEGEGTVKTVWRPAPGDAEDRRPLEVNAKEFVYLRSERQLRYSRSVRAHEAGRTVRCNELDLRMDAKQRIESLLCQGNAIVEDPINGRTVRGDEALYTPADREMVISGAPVILKQRDGTEMEGRRLRYNLDTGQVRILSEPRVPAPATKPSEAAEPDDG